MWSIIAVAVIVIICVIAITLSICKAAGRADDIMEQQYYEHIKSDNITHNNITNEKGE